MCIVCDLYLDGDLQIYKTYQYPPKMYFLRLEKKKKMCRQNLIVPSQRRDKYHSYFVRSINNLFGELQNLGKWNNRTQKKSSSTILPIN